MIDLTKNSPKLQEPEPVTAIIVGAGRRSMIYANYAERFPDRLKIVGVADPNAFRRNELKARFGFGEERCFEDAYALARSGRIADAIINGTMDEDHVPTSIPLLKLGYHMLLEKPLAINEKEMFELLDIARQYGGQILICHVLRYASFYRKIKSLLMSGAIGQIISIQQTEQVSYHHTATSYIRGKWGNKEICGTPILLAKSSHDIDLMIWLVAQDPQIITSMGSDFQFRPENKPKDAGTRCLVDCPLVDSCVYSAKSHYLMHPHRWDVYVWADLEAQGTTTPEQKEAHIRDHSDYGRCVWESNRDNVDHQAVLMHFENGSTGTFNLISGAAKPDRTIHIFGTHGEIFGSMNDNQLTLRTIDPTDPHDYQVQTWTADELTAGDERYGDHGGGDLRVVEDWVALILGEEPSVSATTIEDSILGHLVVFRAEEAMETGTMIPMRPILDQYEVGHHYLHQGRFK